MVLIAINQDFDKKNNNCYPTSGCVIYRLDWLFGVLYPLF